jgi:hypothetical protein
MNDISPADRMDYARPDRQRELHLHGPSVHLLHAMWNSLLMRSRETLHSCKQSIEIAAT